MPNGLARQKLNLGRQRLFTASSGDRALHALYDLYVSSRQPFFVDIAGPDPLLGLKDFCHYCHSEESRIWVCHINQSIAAFFQLSDLQPGLNLANLDVWFRGEIPALGSDLAIDFYASLNAACSDMYISRVQTLVLAGDISKIRLLESLDFQREGVLREHFFHEGFMHDLVALAHVGEDRREN